MFSHNSTTSSFVWQNQNDEALSDPLYALYPSYPYWRSHRYVDNDTHEGVESEHIPVAEVDLDQFFCFSLTFEQVAAYSFCLPAPRKYQTTSL